MWSVLYQIVVEALEPGVAPATPALVGAPMPGDARHGEVVAEDRDADFAHVLDGRAGVGDLLIAAFGTANDLGPVIAWQVLNGQEIEPERLDELLRPDQLDKVEHALLPHDRTMQDDVGHTHLLRVRQILLRQQIFAELQA